MTVMEKFGIPEPQWILEKTESGPLFWRNNTGNNARVKFRYDVEVKEFSRGEHELEEADWSPTLPKPNTLTMSITCIFCVAVTVILPWYILIGAN